MKLSHYSNQATSQTSRDPITSSAKGFFSSPKRPDPPLGPPILLFNGYRGSFRVLRRLERDDNYSLPPSAEFKNEWSYSSTIPIRLHGVDRNFIRLIQFFLNTTFTVTCRRATCLLCGDFHVVFVLRNIRIFVLSCLVFRSVCMDKA